MAVRTDNIAFGDFVQDKGRPGTADHPRYGITLRHRITVIEVHSAWRQPFGAVRTWHIPEAIKELGLGTPSTALSLEIRRRTGRHDLTSCMHGLGTNAVAVGAYDVTLADFDEESGAGPEHRAARRELKRLRSGVAMIEVHLKRQE